MCSATCTHLGERGAWTLDVIILRAAQLSAFGMNAGSLRNPLFHQRFRKPEISDLINIGYAAYSKRASSSPIQR
jgi:hypothetical protein